jgi:hypothetical protein
MLYTVAEERSGADNSEKWIIQKFGNNRHPFCIQP